MQAEAILNMRLRSLRRLEEMEIRKEHKALSKERKDIQALLKDEKLRWDRIAGGTRGDPQEIRRPARWARGAPELGVAPAAVEVASEAFVEREPITVILSEKGWIRAVKGHVGDDAELRFKEGDRLKRCCTARPPTG